MVKNKIIQIRGHCDDMNIIKKLSVNDILIEGKSLSNEILNIIFDFRAPAVEKPIIS